eukprot:366342-Chlamydomonas_euryale.AAC.1
MHQRQICRQILGNDAPAPRRTAVLCTDRLAVHGCRSSAAPMPRRSCARALTVHAGACTVRCGGTHTHVSTPRLTACTPPADGPPAGGGPSSRCLHSTGPAAPRGCLRRTPTVV